MQTASTHHQFRSSIALTVGTVAVLCLVLGGCYEHVVGVQGPGSDGIDVYEPNLKQPVRSPYTEPDKVPSKKYDGR
jgi:hypothetical protein